MSPSISPSRKKAPNGSKWLPAGRFLRESGLLFKINREILHPLGLALTCEQQDDGNIVLIDWLMDNRDELGGMIFEEYGENDPADKRLSEFMRNFGTAKIEERKQILGYVIQPYGEIR